MVLRVEEDRIAIIAVDKGPGIPNLSLAMQEGYSTAPDYIREMGFGAGMGLSNIKRNSDELEIDTEIGKGTKLVSVIYIK
jgi:anti-sigma regulatory factor (Ser/Thr protein kinase)